MTAFRRSALLSAGLHGTLAAVLIGLYRLPPPADTPAPIEARLVWLDRGTQLDRDNGQAAAEPPAGAPVAEERTEKRETLTASAPPELPAPVLPPAEAAEAQPKPEPEPEPERAPPTQTIADPVPLRAAAENAAAPAPKDDSTAPISPLSPEPALEPPREPSIAYRPASAREQRLLQHELASIAASNEGDWSPKTFRGRDGRQYRAQFSHRPATGDSLALDHVLVEISTADGGSRLSTQLRMKRLSFSSYAQFVDRWDPQVQIHDDEIDGRFHSNTAINVRYSAFTKPTFHGLVTTAARDVATDGIGRLDEGGMFRGGLETGVRRIALPREFTPLVADGAQIEHVSGDVFLTFYADGGYGLRLDERSAAERRGTIGAGALYVLGGDDDTDVHVSGTVRGRALVYTPGRIVIENDVQYAEYPTLAPNARDFLGLVADGNVEIASADVTGPGDLFVTASIYARRQFAVRGFRSRHTGTLRIFGSVAAGSITATEPRFATEIRFDPRLESLRPPGFPQTDRYEVDAWDGQWRLDSPDAAAAAAE